MKDRLDHLVDRYHEMFQHWMLSFSATLGAIVIARLLGFIQ